MKQQQPTLDARISQALGSDAVVADDLQSLIPEAEAGIEEVDAVAARERAKSLDPHTAPQAAEQAAHRASVAELQRGRYQIALPRLREKLADALRVEHEDRWNAEANKVAAAVDVAAKWVGRYSEWAELIAVALANCEAVNREVERINSSAPDDVHRRIDKIDLAPFKTLVLPDPAHPNQNFWPPRQPTIAEQYLAGMVPVNDPRYSADWAKASQARDAAVRAAAGRHAEYTANLTKQQEENWNRDERERARRP